MTEGWNRFVSGALGVTTSTAAAVCMILAGCAPQGGGGAAGVVPGGGGGSSGRVSVVPQADVEIGPEEDFDGTALRRTFSLVNQGANLLRWEARVSKPWLSLQGPATGDLAPGLSVQVTVDIDPSGCDQAGAESAVANVQFVDLDTQSAVAQRAVTVRSSFGGSDGWTTFAPSADTRTIHVSSSSGNDQNDGLSPSTPVRTLAAGKALLRHGYPDWMLLRRGDAWQESLGQWKKSGRSQSEPMLLSAYGSASTRPRLDTGVEGGIWTNGGGGSPPTIDNLAIVGLHFKASGFNGTYDCVGARMLQPGSHFLLEDCLVQGYGSNLVFQGYGGRHTDFRLRRCVIVDAYTVHGPGLPHSQGLYAYAVDGLLLEENVFDHNGWSETVPNAWPDIYRHNLYIDNDNTGVVARGNIIANASSHGMQLRPGGSAVNNLFIRNAIALSVGGGNNPELSGVTADVRGNVILDGKNIDATHPRGWGLWMANIDSGRVSWNVIANNTLGTQPSVLSLDGTFMGDTHPSIGVHDLVIESNVLYEWGGSLTIQGDTSKITNIDLLNNDVQSLFAADPLVQVFVPSTTAALDSAGNHFFSQPLPASSWTEIGSAPHTLAYWMTQVGDSSSTVQQVAYPEPTRSAASYNANLGGSFSLSAFLAEARKQSRTSWRPEYTAARANRYVRGGF